MKSVATMARGFLKNLIVATEVWFYDLVLHVCNNCSLEEHEDSKVKINVYLTIRKGGGIL